MTSCHFGSWKQVLTLLHLSIVRRKWKVSPDSLTLHTSSKTDFYLDLMMYLSTLSANVLVMIAFGNLCNCLSTGYKSVLYGSSFSSAIKAFHYNKPGEEVILYKEVFESFGYITEQWFTGGGDKGPFDQHGRIRVYIDGEKTPSIDYTLSLSQAVGTSNEEEERQTPWSTRMFGHLANNGGYYNTFRIPFSTQVVITLQNDVSTGNLWYIIRGLVDVPLTVGGFQLPGNSKLHLYKQDQFLDPLQFITLSNSTNAGGFLFLVTMNVQSETANFMEGCMRAHIDGNNKTTFLSSGTEDFFLSAFYFNRGGYHGFHSGLTHKSSGADGTQIVAYKFFVDDPVLFSKSFQLIWRNFETINGPDGCPGQFPPDPKPKDDVPWPKTKSFGVTKPAKAHIQSYVWVYEWPVVERQP